MVLERDWELVGMLVGSIIEDAPVLVFYLYVDENGRHWQRVQIVGADPDTGITARAVMWEKVDRWKVRARNVFRTANGPYWYYLQLDRRYPPKRLCVFSLPWSCYADANAGEPPISGLV